LHIAKNNGGKNVRVIKTVGPIVIGVALYLVVRIVQRSIRQRCFERESEKFAKLFETGKYPQRGILDWEPDWKPMPESDDKNFIRGKIRST
jgi:hypothetical protein